MFIIIGLHKLALHKPHSKHVVCVCEILHYIKNGSVDKKLLTDKRCRTTRVS